MKKTLYARNRIEQAIRLFREYCTRNNMRYTPERETIIREIYLLNDHFNIDNLFYRIRAKHPKTRIAKTSIYRSVPHFLDAGLLRQSIAEAGQVIYERTLGHADHDHFRCINCGRIIEFYSPELKSAQKKISRREKFTVLWRINVINGYCQDCQRRQIIKEDSNVS